MTYSQKPPISKVNLVPEDKDYTINLSWIFGPEVAHLTIDQKWEKVAQAGHPTTGGYPLHAPDAKYMAETVRKVVEDYNLYDLMFSQRLEVAVVFRDPDTWGVRSQMKPVLPDLKEKGFRLRIDHFLSANLDREDIGWDMVLRYLREQCPWQGVIHEEQLSFFVKQVRNHFDVNDLFKLIRQNKAAFLGIKDTPHRKMEIKEPQNGYCSVYTPEPFWQLEFVEKELLLENPLETFYDK